ncbi:MAG: Fur family transcriptional regulator [Anaerolineaceae bacterium]
MRTSSVDKIIIEALSKENGHLTSLQIYEEIRVRLPAVNQSTVYRALERLAHLGRVSVSDIGAGAVVYELVNGNLHHHLICQNCGCKVTISDSEVQEFFGKVAKDNHFKIVTNHLILFGLCPGCQPDETARDAGTVG